MKFKRIVYFLFSVLAAVFFTTCGLEDYPFIYPVYQANITQDMNYRAVVRIPNNNPSPPFSHFAIFYRIYVSDVLVSSTTSSASYSQINQTLSSNYNSIYPYIDSTTLVNTNMETLFQGLGFMYLYLQTSTITSAENVLGSNVLGSTLTFDFTSQKYPTMTIDDTTEYILCRSNGNGTFSPRPDRYFVNTDDLWNSDYINANTNADVVNKSSFTQGTRYTYAALYIVAVGVDDSTYASIYSTPSLIHVFLLPDSWY